MIASFRLHILLQTKACLIQKLTLPHMCMVFNNKPDQVVIIVGLLFHDAERKGWEIPLLKNDHLKVDYIGYQRV